MQRFFDSSPITTTAEAQLNYSERFRNMSPVEQGYGGSGESGSGGQSSGSNLQTEGTTNTSNAGTRTSSGSYLPPMLTEELLFKHNEDMEMFLVKRHKSNRGGKGSDKNRKGSTDKDQLTASHGLKRSGSHSWEGEAHKTTKLQHFSENYRDIPATRILSYVPNTHLGVRGQFGQPPRQNLDLWPPFSMANSSQVNQQAAPMNNMSNHFSVAPGIFPTVYYSMIPQQHNLPDTSGYRALQYMTPVYSQQFMYPQPTMMYPTIPFQSTFQRQADVAGGQTFNVSSGDFIKNLILN